MKLRALLEELGFEWELEVTLLPRIGLPGPSWRNLKVRTSRWTLTLTLSRAHESAQHRTSYVLVKLERPAKPD